jgi:hypothetical protein
VSRKKVVTRDVKFEEKLASRILYESLIVIEEKEQQTLKDEQQSEVQNSGGEEELSPSSPFRRTGWLLHTLKDAGEDPKSVVREHKLLRRFMNYMVLMSNVIDVDPCNFEEAVDQQAWWDDMVEEYTSIMRNEFWDIVPRPEGKSFVISIDEKG